MIEKIQFGNTGHQSTRTLFGAAALWQPTQAEADRTLRTLLDYGVNHIDVAASYGEAEHFVGPWMDRHRADFFLASKTGERTRAGAYAEIRRSLERLHTDHLDLIQLHAVLTDAELDQILAPGGALEAAVQARDEGLVRFIGITSHTTSAPGIHLRALEHFAFDSVLLPYNYPMLQDHAYAAGFNHLQAVCAERNVAVQTIKSICRRPWPEGAEHSANTWYEPLSAEEDIRKAVGYVLRRPGLFLNTAGEVNLLPIVLEAASQADGSVTDEDMAALVQARDMTPLWSEPTGAH
jgi:aryl-alcohol dehydrogenase-like predicted oxidoreductase